MNPLLDKFLHASDSPRRIDFHLKETAIATPIGSQVLSQLS